MPPYPGSESLSPHFLREKPSFGAILRAGAPGCIAATACLGFFLNKAFTIDDTIFLRGAQQAMRTPVHPFAFDMCWNGFGQVYRFSQFVANAPLMSYLLIPAVRSASPEIAGHVIQLFLLLAAVLATASLALRLGLGRRGATLAAALTATSPAVLGMAATVMPDILAMTLGAVAVERFIAWRQDGRWWNTVLATVAMGLAPMARPQMVLLLPACALFGASRPLRTEWRGLVRGLLLMAAAGILYFAAAAVTKDPAAHATVVHERLIRLAPFDVLARGLSLGCYLALTTSFVAGVLLFMVKQPRVLVATVTLAAVPAAMFALTGDTEWIVVAASAVAYVTIVWCLTRVVKAGTGTLLALGLWALLPMGVVVYLHMAAKYLVPAVPAYSILLIWLAGNSGNSDRWIARALIPAGLIFGALIVSADTRAANMARDAVNQWLPPLQARGDRVLFQGQWGFQWYAELQGARCFDPTSAVSARPGDYVMVDLTGDVSFIRLLYPRVRLVDAITDATAGGVLLNRARNVGFYSDYVGHLPWYWAPAGTLRFELWRIE